MSLNPSSSCSAPAPCAGLSFSGRAVFGAASAGLAHKAAGAGPDAINLLNAGRPVQPAAKLLDNWFNGNSTSVNVNNRPKAAVAPVVDNSRMIRSFVAM
jgi:hypothetical protein